MAHLHTHRQFLSVEKHGHPLGAAGDVIGPPGHERHGVPVQVGHLELGQVGLEGHLGVVGLAGVDGGLARRAHVVLPSLEDRRKTRATSLR